MVRSLHVPMDDDDFEYLRDELKPADYQWKEFLIEAGELHKEQAQSDDLAAKKSESTLGDRRTHRG